MQDEVISQLTRPPTGLCDEYMGAVTMTDGQTLKIETSPQGDELLEYQVPMGMTALVKVRIAVQEMT
jgi:hypothetical protein